MPFYLSNRFQPGWRWPLQKTQYFVALLPAPAVNRDYRSLGALPAVHMRCCPLYFASCFAFPWDISGESVAHTAVLDSHVLAVAPPEVPVAVCTGCFLHTAEASSSPSDPLGLKAAKQVVTCNVYPATYRNHSQLPKNPRRKLPTGWRREAEARLPLLRRLNPTVTFWITAGFLLPFQTNRCFTKNKPNEKSFCADVSPMAGGQGRRAEGSLKKMNYQCKWLFPIVGSSLMSRYSTTR